METIIGIWAVGFSVFVLNGFAAGLAAALHVWRKDQPRRSRVLTAAGITALVPVVITLPAIYFEVSTGASAVVPVIVGFAFICGVTMAISLPGAVIIARKLDGPGEAYRAFE